MSHDTQTILAFAIVAVAAWNIGRRLWGQILAFRSRPARRKASAKSQPAKAAAVPLIQVQLTPPARLKRPPTQEASPSERKAL